MKSPWKKRPLSWKGPRFHWLVGTLPVMSSMAEESAKAPAMAATMLAEPGPQEDKVATGFCLIRK